MFLKVYGILEGIREVVELCVCVMVGEMGPHMATITHTAPLIAADPPPRLQLSHLQLKFDFVCVCVSGGIPGSGGQNVHTDEYFATLAQPSQIHTP